MSNNDDLSKLFRSDIMKLAYNAKMTGLGQQPQYMVIVYSLMSDLSKHHSEEIQLAENTLSAVNCFTALKEFDLANTTNDSLRANLQSQIDAGKKVADKVNEYREYLWTTISKH